MMHLPCCGEIARPLFVAKGWTPAATSRLFLAASLLMDGSHTQTLQKALEVLGNDKNRLSIALEMPLPELEAYLSGEKPLPHTKFIEALDIVANHRGS